MGSRKLKLAYANTDISDTARAVEVKKKARMSGAEIYVLAISIFIVLLFGYTSVNKLITTDVFIFQMRLVPMELLNKSAPYLAWGVPILELAIIGLLIPDRTRYIALIAAFFLMLIFQAYIIWLRSTGLDLPCTCGGIISSMSWYTHLIFNWAVITLIASAVYINNRRWWNNKLIAVYKRAKDIF